MSENNWKVGQTVQIIGKNLKGQIAYVGLTNFSPGKWIGVILQEGRGKNNGTVKGVCYFKCASKCGLFVRPTQLIAMDVTAISAVAAATAAVTVSTQQCEEDAAAAQIHLRSDDEPTCSASILKTTKISQPKQPKQFLSSSNHQISPLQSAVVSASNTTVSTRIGASSTEQCAMLCAALPIAPKRSKTSVSPSESFCCAKRASFIETGFLEILRPQFTPGHPIRSPSFCTSTLGVSERQKEERKEQETIILILTEELDDLKKQRAEDKRKLHELEKIRMQNEQLTEFKSQIMEQHCLLQRELQRTRQDIREANDTKSKYKRELDEVAEGIEILTLDKEMAEERAETMQIELEMAQERIEELILDVEILRAENDESLQPRDGRKDDNLPTAGELRKMEQYNQRLRETVVRLRDVLTQEKQNLQKASKALETKHSEIAELKKTKEMLSKRVDVMEMHIIDLKEQVDAALGAESMVSSLADVKLELEDRVKLLEEEVAELEALEDIQAQLIEGNQELEVDLREEIDILNVTIKTLHKEKDNAMETIYDRDITIMKFRELVKTLKDPTITSTSEDFSTISNQEDTQSIDFNQVFSVTKAYGRAIDVQLNAVELKLSQIHIDYLLAFVPEDFLLRGGEHDIILVLLLLQRLSEKVEIVCNAINEKFPSSCEFVKDAIFEGFSVHRFAFRSKCVYFLQNLKLVLQQIIFMLNHCDYEVCTHAAIYRNEMDSQEKNIDEMLRLLKSGLLDENSPIDTIERTLSFFNMLHTNLTSSQDLTELIDEHQLYMALMEVFDVGFDCINTNASMLHTIIQLGDENTDSFYSMQFLMENMANFKLRMKKLHRKLPSTCNSTDFSGMQDRDRLKRIHTTNDYLRRLINILAASAKQATKEISIVKEDFGSDIAIDHEKLWKIIIFNCANMNPEEHQSPLSLFQYCIELLDAQINEFFNFATQTENVRNTNMNTMIVRSSATTLFQRSTQVKQHFENFKTLSQSLIEREKEIKTLKYVAKMKQNEFSEMQIRKEMAERLSLKLQKEQRQAMADISEYVENIENEIRCKEVAITRCFTTWTEKLTKLEQSCSALEKNLQTNCQANNTTSNQSTTEIIMLTNCLRKERTERTKLQSENLKARFKNFEPLYVPKPNANQNIRKLEQELRSLKNEWILSHIAINSNSNVDRTHSNIKRKSDTLCKHIINTYFDSNPHRAIPSDFARFSTNEMRVVLN